MKGCCQERIAFWLANRSEFSHTVKDGNSADVAIGSALTIRNANPNRPSKNHLPEFYEALRFATSNDPIGASGPASD